MDEVLKEIEEKSIGWDREKARNVLAESLDTIQIAARVARQAVQQAENMPEEFVAGCQDLKAHMKDLQAKSLVGGSKKLGYVTRAESNKIIRTLDQILNAMDVARIVSLSLDLTKQAQMFVGMMEVISRRFGEEERAKAEDITQQLNPEQLIQVFQWVRENQIDSR